MPLQQHRSPPRSKSHRSRRAHVDPPKPWGEGPENESLADEVLDELHREAIISATERDYYAGSCTRSEARAAHLSDDPAVRAARIVRLFTIEDDRINRAIRVAVTSQSTRKRITPKLCDELATALILRANTDDPAKSDQIRRYLRESFGKASHRATWESTDRPVDKLAEEALKEVRHAITTDPTSEPGPASLELAVRAAYPLVVSGRLAADRGSANNNQPDRRNPGEVLDTMRRSIQGVYQLAQSLQDFTANKAARRGREWQCQSLTGWFPGEVMISDVYLRGEFPPPGKARAPRPGDTPDDVFHNRVSAPSRWRWNNWSKRSLPSAKSLARMAGRSLKIAAWIRNRAPRGGRPLPTSTTSLPFGVVGSKPSMALRMRQPRHVAAKRKMTTTMPGGTTRRPRRNRHCSKFTAADAAPPLAPMPSGAGTRCQ